MAHNAQQPPGEKPSGAKPIASPQHLQDSRAADPA
jgi:hypothetical protein